MSADGSPRKNCEAQKYEFDELEEKDRTEDQVHHEIARHASYHSKVGKIHDHGQYKLRGRRNNWIYYRFIAKSIFFGL